MTSVNHTRCSAVYTIHIPQYDSLNNFFRELTLSRAGCSRDADIDTFSTPTDSSRPLLHCLLVRRVAVISVCLLVRDNRKLNHIDPGSRPLITVPWTICKLTSGPPSSKDQRDRLPSLSYYLLNAPPQLIILR